MFHETALVESDDIGQDTRIFAYAHVMDGAVIGERVSIGDHVFIEAGVRIGNNVTIKNGVYLWEGITIEDDVFLGPRATFTNDRFPRSPRMEAVRSRYADKANWLEPTLVRRGCSIGAAATICPGLELGAYSTIAAGSIVTRNVPSFSLSRGVPAVEVGSVCSCGQRLDGPFDSSVCGSCGEGPEQRRETLQRLERSTLADLKT